jgi:hypothetical protein
MKNNYFNESENSISFYQRNFSISLPDENIICVRLDQGDFLFPKISCENFTAKNVI